MKFDSRSPPVSRDAWILGLAISQAIRYSKSEKDALERICTLLGYWEIEIAPSELGAGLGVFSDV